MSLNLDKSELGKKYYYSEDGVALGPLSISQLLEKIDSETYVYRQGIEWTIAKDVEELKKFFMVKEAHVASTNQKVNEYVTTEHFETQKSSEQIYVKPTTVSFAKMPFLLIVSFLILLSTLIVWFVNYENKQEKDLLNTKEIFENSQKKGSVETNGTSSFIDVTTEAPINFDSVDPKDLIELAKVVYNGFSVALVNESPSELISLLSPIVSEWYGKFNVKREKIAEDWRYKYLSKWSILNDELIDLYPSVNSDGYIAYRLYSIRSKEDQSIIKHFKIKSFFKFDKDHLIYEMKDVELIRHVPGISDDEATIFLKNYYEDLAYKNYNNEVGKGIINIDASKYYANQISQYIVAKNLTPERLNNIWRKEKEYMDKIEYIKTPITFIRESEGVRFFEYSTEFKCWRNSKKAFQECEIRKEVGFDTNKKIVSYRELSIVGLRFTPLE